MTVLARVSLRATELRSNLWDVQMEGIASLALAMTVGISLAMTVLARVSLRATELRSNLLDVHKGDCFAGARNDGVCVGHCEQRSCEAISGMRRWRDCFAGARNDSVGVWVIASNGVAKQSLGCADGGDCFAFARNDKGKGARKDGVCVGHCEQRSCEAISGMRRWRGLLRFRSQ